MNDVNRRHSYKSAKSANFVDYRILNLPLLLVPNQDMAADVNFFSGIGRLFRKKLNLPRFLDTSNSGMYLAAYSRKRFT